MSRTRLSTYTAPPAEVARTLDALRAHYEVPTAFPPEALVEAEAAAGAVTNRRMERNQPDLSRAATFRTE